MIRSMDTIADQRKASGWTQERLAEELGVTQAAVAHWENGRRNPSVETLKKVAAALGVPLMKLIE